MPQITELNDDNFEAAVQSANRAGLPVLADFWSPACRPCLALVPILEELAEENEGEAVIAKVNAAANAKLAAQYEIDMLPTILIFHNGKIIERMTGVQSKQKLQTTLDEIE